MAFKNIQSLLVGKQSEESMEKLQYIIKCAPRLKLWQV